MSRPTTTSVSRADYTHPLPGLEDGLKLIRTNEFQDPANDGRKSFFNLDYMFDMCLRNLGEVASVGMVAVADNGATIDTITGDMTKIDDENMTFVDRQVAVRSVMVVNCLKFEGDVPGVSTVASLPRQAFTVTRSSGLAPQTEDAYDGIKVIRPGNGERGGDILFARYVKFFIKERLEFGFPVHTVAVVDNKASGTIDTIVGEVQQLVNSQVIFLGGLEPTVFEVDDLISLDIS